VPILETANTQEELVWFTLQDILSRIDTRKLNAYAFRISGIRPKGKTLQLTGTLMCKGSGEDNALLSVKAVTPNDLFVRRDGRRCAIQVVVDV
jgi:SHS2 domain-containing protein